MCILIYTTRLNKRCDTRNVGDREVVGGTTTKRACYVCGSYNHLQNVHAKVANKTYTPSTTPKRVNVVNTNSSAVVSSVEGASASVVGIVSESGPVTNVIGSLSTSSATYVNSHSSTDNNIIKASVCDVAISECNVEHCNDVCDVKTSNNSNLSILSDFSKLQFIDVRVSDDCNVSCNLEKSDKIDKLLSFDVFTSHTSLQHSTLHSEIATSHTEALIILLSVEL